MADNIVAIDLGTSHLTGIVGEKKTDGTFYVVAYETVDTDSCIRRGIIYNRDNTAAHVGNLLRKLESHLKGDYIDSVYIGVGGQSLRTIDHIETLEIADGAAVTDEDIALLREQCEKYKPDLVDVLAVAPAVYSVDGRRDPQPVGVPCKRFEAHYKLVIGRSSIRNDIAKSIGELSGKKIAGILVSPMTLADAMLSPEEKELGCALVNFGAGVTSVSIFKDGHLAHISVIPLGGKLITRDIASLQLTEADAERLKKEKGNAILSKEDENELIPVEMEGADREIKRRDLNAIIEARTKEIVDNVYARISEVIELRSLGSGIVLAGCASELNGLPEVLKDKCKVNVRYSTIRKELVKGSNEILGNPTLMTAISILLQGTGTCVSKHSVLIPDNEGNNQPLQDIGSSKNTGNTNTLDTVNNTENQSDGGKDKETTVEPPKKRKFKDKLKDIFVTDLFDA